MAKCRGSGCEWLESRRLLDAGGLDPSFGSGGQATADFGVAVTATAAVVQSDGKTVVVGHSADKRFAVARYNLDGSLDTTFGPSFTGTVLTSFVHGTFARAVALQDDGKIVVAGGSDAQDGADVARYHPDGTLDRSFAGDGKLNFDFGFYADNPLISAVVILPRQSLDAPQRILLGGNVSAGGPFTERNQDFFVVRLNGADGTPDGSFDDDGYNVVGLGASEYLSDMAVDFTGTAATNPHYGAIVAAGTKSDIDGTFSEFAILRLTAGGSVDRSFDGDGSGTVTIAPGVKTSASGLVIQSDGKYVLGGTAGIDFAMARFLSTGPLDGSFGTAGTGWARTDMGGIERATDVTASYDGGLILGGTSKTGPVGQPTVTRDAFAAYTANGIPDPRFGSTGRWTTSFAGGGGFAEGPGRRFVFAGGPRMHAARFLDVGANIVRAVGFDVLGYEQSQGAASFILYRSENLPAATRVYFSLLGTADPPRRGGGRGGDYSGVTRPLVGNAYVDIPAGQSFTTVTITPMQDTVVEGNEIASLAILPDAAYEVGSPSVVSVVIVDDDAPPPGPAEVYVRSSTWAGPDAVPENVTFMEYLKSVGLGHEKYGYRTNDKPAADVLPWTNLDEIVVHYTSPPVLAGAPPGSNIVLDGIRGDYPVTSITTLDPETFVLRIARPLGGNPPEADTNGDRIHFALPGSGGYHHFDINVLQGDSDKSGSVLAADFSEVKRRFFRSASIPGAGAGAYSAFADVDGSGAVLANDFSEVKKRFFHSLPRVGVATAAAAPAPMKPITGALLGWGDPIARPSEDHRSSWSQIS